jgi:hypothetical protein
MRLRCLFNQCEWHYLGAFEQADPTHIPGTQGQRGLYQCWHCKTVSLGSPIDPRGLLRKVQRVMDGPTAGKAAP